MGPEALESSCVSGSIDSGLQSASESSGAFNNDSGDIDSDLKQIIEAWPELSASIRQSILSLVNANPHG